MVIPTEYRIGQPLPEEEVKLVLLMREAGLVDEGRLEADAEHGGIAHAYQAPTEGPPC